MREDQVEQAVRDSLERHAREADVDVPVAERARAAADRGAGPGRLLLVAAAVVAVVAGGVAIAQTRGGGADNGPSRPTPTAAVDVPADWRTEAWHGVEVKVPPEWGWGGAPQDPRPWLDCGVGPARTVAGKAVEPDAALPYVGRPVTLTDACGVLDPNDRPAPRAPYVWLGAHLEPGEVRLADYVQETVKVGGTTVTVTTKDPAQRAQILGTVQPSSAYAGCAATLDAVPDADGQPTEGIRKIDSASVCAYTSRNGAWDLAYAADLGAAAGQRFYDAVYDGGRAQSVECTGVPNEVAVIRLSGDDPFGEAPGTPTFVVRMGACSSLSEPLGHRVPLTVPRVEPWAVGAVPVTLHGPFDETGELAEFFIGLLG